MALMNPQDPENGWTAFDYARGILHELQRMNEESGDDADPPVARIRRTFAFNVDGNGNGAVELGLPPGVAWSLLTYALTTSPGTTTGYIAFYRDVEEGTGLIKVTPAANLQDDAFNAEGHFIPEQSKLLIVARGLPVNTQVAGNVAMKGIQNAVPRHSVGGDD